MDYFYQIDIFFLFRIEINQPAIPADPPIHHPPRPVLSGCHPCLPPMHTRLNSQEKAYFYCGIVLFLKKVHKKSVLFENVLYHNDYAKFSQYIVVLIQRTWNILDSTHDHRLSRWFDSAPIRARCRPCLKRSENLPTAPCPLAAAKAAL